MNRLLKLIYSDFLLSVSRFSEIAVFSVVSVFSVSVVFSVIFVSSFSVFSVVSTDCFLKTAKNLFFIFFPIFTVNFSFESLAISTDLVQTEWIFPNKIATALQNVKKNCESIIFEPNF